MRRSLIFFWRSHLAVAAAAAVATAVLSGALVVGDSVKGSLADLARERLGRIDDVMAGDRLVREELAAEVETELGAEATVAAALLLPGAAVDGKSGQRASKVTVLGVDGRFSDLYPQEAPLDFERRPGQVFPSVILNQALAGELSAEVGAEVILSFEALGDPPKETLVGRDEGAESLAVSRWSVAAIVPDRGRGGFALAAQQARSFNAFVERGRLGRILDQRGKANALFIARGGASAEQAKAALARRLTLEDFGLNLRPGSGATVLESRRFVLENEAVAKAAEWARTSGETANPVLTYLANEIAANGRTVPYSTVAASDAPGLVLADGSAAAPLAAGEIYLSSWAAEDLGAQVGDEVELTYFVLGARDELSEAKARFRLRAVVALAGLGADPSLTPEFPGMSDSQNMADWDPPFPVDLTRIRPLDEAYWDRFKSAPKAFLSLADGQRLWRSRFGEVTSVRFVGGAVRAEELARSLAPEAMGLKLESVRERALTAAQGATDFAGLFLGFSWFLIVSSALLVALLFRLGVEQRAKEVGLLSALGYPLKRVRRRLLAEGGVVALLGVGVGTFAGLGYAALMLWGLRTLWQGAVGTPLLFVHARPATLGVGAVVALLLVGISIRWALASLLRVPSPALLAGSTALEAAAGARGLARWVAWVALLLGVALVVAALFGEESARPGLAFGTGAALLVAGLAAFAAWCRRSGAGRRSHLAARGLWALAARSAARNAGRSVVSVALVASASFLLVAVGAQRGHRAADATDRASGTGGFTLVAESDAPLYVDLSLPARRAELGFTAEQEAAVAGARVLPFRVLPGEDASCLNLFRPGKPRVLGAPPEFLVRGGFAFTKTARAVENPWTLLEEDLGPGVIPAVADANSAQWILKLGIGDELELSDDAGRPLRLRLVGMLAKSLFQSELVISGTTFDRHFAGHGGYRSFLIESAPEAAAGASAAFEAALARFGFDVTSTVERLAAFQAVENTYLSTFQLLGGLGLLLGTLGLGVVLLRNVLERRAELAALSAFGFARSRLRALVVAENAFLLLLGLGLGTSAALVAVAPHLLAEAAAIPWLSLFATLALVFAVGLLASIAAVRVALATPLLAALRGR